MAYDNAMGNMSLEKLVQFQGNIVQLIFFIDIDIEINILLLVVLRLFLI